MSNSGFSFGSSSTTPSLFGTAPKAAGTPFGTTPQAPATSGFSGFGAPAAIPSSAPAFGATPAPATSGFSGFGAPSATPAPAFGATPAPTTSGFGGFGAPSASAPAFGATPAPATSGFSGFGAPSATPAPAPAASGFGAPSTGSALGKTPATAGASLFGTAPTSSLFGTPSTTGPAPSTAANTPSLFGASALPSTATATSSLFGAPASSVAPSVTSSQISSGTPAATTASSFVAPTSKLYDFKSFLPFRTFTAPAASGQAITSNNTSTAQSGLSKPAIEGLPALKGKTMEEIINKWNQELELQTREFHKSAQQVAKWDLSILENGCKISKIYEQLQSTQSMQKEIDQSLEYIEAQQNDLDSALDSYHGQLKSLMDGGSQGNGRLRMTPADEEREKAYSLAESLNTQLDDMSSQLSSLIEEMNTIGGNKETDDDPMSVITRILGEHLTSLEWVNESVNDLGSRLQSLHTVAESAKAQTDRVHRLDSRGLLFK